VGPLGEQWVIDRRKITQSRRAGSGEGAFAPIDPASYPEDWDILTDEVVRATWRTPFDGLEIYPLGVIVDSGGEAGSARAAHNGSGKRQAVRFEDEKGGVTHNAYDWWRRIRLQGLGKRVFLYKGGGTKSAPDIRVTEVGKVSGKGVNDIPLLLCNPNKLSDQVAAGLRRATEGAGYIHFPAPKHTHNNPNGWVGAWFFDELEAEVREADGTWRKIRKRNETFDHCRMQRALMHRLGIFKVKDWEDVPAHLAPLERNSFTVTREDRRAAQGNTTVSAASDVVAAPKAAPRLRKRRFSLPNW